MLSIFKTVFHPILIYVMSLILIYGQESWVMAERIRSQLQASEMRFLRRIEGVTLLSKMRSSEIWISMNIKLLFLWIENLSLVVWPCKQNASGKASQTNFTCESKKSGGMISNRLGRLHWGSRMEWNRFRINQAKSWKWWWTEMCGGLILSFSPRNPYRYERALKEEEDDAIKTIFGLTERLNINGNLSVMKNFMMLEICFCTLNYWIMIPSICVWMIFLTNLKLCWMTIDSHLMIV